MRLICFQDKFVCMICALALIARLGLGAPCPAAAAEEDPDALQAKEAVLLDEGSGRLLFSKSPTDRVAPASLTKVMTALLVLENGDLDRKVYISRRAAETGESTVWLEPGEIFSRRELLYALLLSSANDAATALAESVAATEDDFVELMNRRALELQLDDTHFSNCHGLDEQDHYSSAYDLAVLSRQAMLDPFFRQAVATKTANLPWVGHPWPRLLINKNRLLYRYNGAIGIKTGYTRKAGNCVIGAAQRGSLGLIAVVLNSPDVYGDLEKLLDYGFQNYQGVALEDKDPGMIRVRVANGLQSSVDAGPDRKIIAALQPGEAGEISCRTRILPGIAAPVKKGAVLGAVEIFLAGRQIGSVNLVASSDVLTRTTIWSRLLGGLRAAWYRLAG